MSDIFSHPSFDAHEQVLFVSDAESGLKGIVAIHNTALGPAVGGCRMHPYMSADEALRDVLRLSRGMTMKNAAAGLPLGGGKCVIIADPVSDNKPALLRAMARHVQSLGGRYWTAIDVGVSSEDVDVMAEATDYVFARASEFAGDESASHYTALGGFQGIRAIATHLFGTDDLQGLRIAVQGVGQTGADLITQLTKEGAEIVAADIDASALSRVVEAYGVRTVAPNLIHAQEVDIFAPCAMGGVLNDVTIPELRCGGIAGLANNQLDRPENGRMLLERGIAYAPDFVVNSGGVIRATMPIFSRPDPEQALENISGLYGTIQEILRRSEREETPSEVIAEAIAFDRIHKATRSKEKG